MAQKSNLSFHLSMKEVCENWSKDSQLANIRRKVKIVSIPIANSWGTSQLSTKIHGNVNNVNLNRNFDYKWANQSFTDSTKQDYQGLAPWSEVESRYIKDMLLSTPNLVAHFDLYALSSGSGFKGYVYTPRPFDYSDALLTNFFNWFPEANCMLRMNENANAVTCLSSVLGLQSITPQFLTKEFGTQQFDATEMTIDTEYYGNVIIQASKYEQKVFDLAFSIPP